MLREKKDLRLLFFLIDNSGTVKTVFTAKDKEEALEFAVGKDKTYSAERVTSKNWRKIRDTLGESAAKDFKTFRKDMSEAFSRMGGMSPGEVAEASRGRELDPTATLAALGLSEVDFKDFEDFDLEETPEDSDGEPLGVTEKEADEALKRAFARLGVDVDEVDLKEYSSLLG